MRRASCHSTTVCSRTRNAVLGIFSLSAGNTNSIDRAFVAIPRLENATRVSPCLVSATENQMLLLMELYDMEV